MKMKKRLKIMCSVYPNFSKIPPQEHGINELKFKIRMIYVVKTVIKPTDKERAFIRLTRRDKASTSSNSAKITRNEIEAA